MSSVFIPLNAFFHTKTPLNELLSTISVVGKSKAAGIEIRRELLNEEKISIELKEIQSLLATYSLFTVYSAPVPLWDTDGQLNESVLLSIFEESSTLASKWIKIPLGHFDPKKADWQSLNLLLKKYPNTTLLIENDQTKEGGRIQPLLSFFENALINMIPVEMTFDMGNWKFLDENSDHAIDLFYPYISYFHMKHVHKDQNSYLTFPLANATDADWRELDHKIPASIPRALEFTIQASVAEINRYIDLIDSNQRRNHSHASN